MTEHEKQEFLIGFGNRIRKLRTNKQLSLDELARKCGYNSENARSSIQKIEAGKSDIPASKIKLLAQALEVPIGEIMGWYDEWDNKFNTENISKSVELFELIEKEHGKSAGEAFTIYVQLDPEDQGEIRGEMKQMLKSEKYSIQKESSNGEVM